MDKNKLLEVKNLSVGFQGEEMTPVVDNISFYLNKGEILGVVGESGSGKTMLSLAIMDLLPRKARIINGEILYKKQNILGQSKESLRRLKGKDMAAIFQQPRESFNPVLKIGDQLDEMFKLHMENESKHYKEKSVDALARVGLLKPEKIYGQYPHEISGGMAQRAMIAMAMIANPQLLIADEPTTALDATTQYKILKLLKEINEKENNSIILISHDLAVIKKICHRILVMKDGKLIETGKADEIFDKPQELYTKKLVQAYFGVGKTPYYLSNKEIKDEILIQTKNLNIYYKEKNKEKFFSKKEKQLFVEEINIQVRKGETFGIVGESGSGKSTLAKALVGIIKDIEGEIITDTSPQMVFQDPYGSLNPVKKVKWILAEPLKNHGKHTRKDIKEKIKQVIYLVGLTENYLERYISELSGGQRQRIAIAVALIRNPRLIVLDEPVSSLDVTVQAQILELLEELQNKLDLTYIFISHDLNVIHQVCDRVGVMYEGKIVEQATTKDLFEKPQHSYTKKLLETLV